jgi:single-strand DNA-binding protein
MSNVFSFSGVIGSDAEVRPLPSGQSVLNVNVANRIGFGDKQQTIWLNVTLWGKRAEGEFKNYLVKGRNVFVSGELTFREYTANDGTKKIKHELNANILELVGKQEQAHGNNYERSTPTVSTTGQYKYESPSTNSGLKYPENGAPYADDIPEDDIPF